MRLCLVLLVTILPAVAHPQAPVNTGRAPGAILGGAVRDSIARTPLPGAIVQLVSTDSLPRFGRTVTADSLGQFTFGDVPMGRYILGFLHPILDSLGVEPTLQQVVVDGHTEMRVGLSTPPPERLRAAICTGPVTPTGVLIGVVRDARSGAPVSGANVAGEWMELSFSASGVTHRVPHLVATTRESGFFALCDVPSAGTMMVAASKGADSTDTIEVTVPSNGVARRDLYLGTARTVVTTDSAPRADSLAPAIRRMRVGDERLSGLVVTAAGLPLANAHVNIMDGPQASANERGEWSIANAPVGTRMLEVRAVGYYPERRAVNVIDGALPVRVVLATLASVLDTVKVTTSRLTGRRDTGFADRSRSGPGKYLTAADIARRQLFVTSDVFRTLSGVRVVHDSDGFATVMIRGVTGDWCNPALYVDGMLLQNWRAEDVDDWIRPELIAGMEIYAGLTAPPQFQVPLSACGSILIWKK
ncbi:MAG: TonB-dependent receptor [Gemmatimonadota bacterium]|nr:TonB-dependent receptor [Gemmatimonadota bacterium]